MVANAQLILAAKKLSLAQHVILMFGAFAQVLHHLIWGALVFCHCFDLIPGGWVKTGKPVTAFDDDLVGGGPLRGGARQ